eukprot:2038018-Rhodomonas_salina.1
MLCIVSRQKVVFCVLLFCTSLSAVPLRKEFETRDFAYFDATLGRLGGAENYSLNNESGIWSSTEQGEGFASATSSEIPFSQSQNSEFNQSSGNQTGISRLDRCEVDGSQPCNSSLSWTRGPHSDSSDVDHHAGKQGKEGDSQSYVAERHGEYRKFTPAGPPPDVAPHHQQRRLLQTANSTLNETSMVETTAPFSTTESLGGGGGSVAGSSTSAAKMVTSSAVSTSAAEFVTGGEGGSTAPGVLTTTAMYATGVSDTPSPTTGVSDMPSSTTVLLGQTSDAGVIVTSGNVTTFMAETSASFGTTASLGGGGGSSTSAGDFVTTTAMFATGVSQSDTPSPTSLMLGQTSYATTGAGVTTGNVTTAVETQAPFTTTVTLGQTPDPCTGGSCSATTVGELLSSTDTLFSTPAPTTFNLNATASEIFTETSATRY